jgi:hypothetical protein
MVVEDKESTLNFGWEIQQGHMISDFELTCKKFRLDCLLLTTWYSVATTTTTTIAITITNVNTITNTIATTTTITDQKGPERRVRRRLYVFFFLSCFF